jgi:hypothetical protein
VRARPSPLASAAHTADLPGSYVGGLLGAHSLTGQAVYLKQARTLADRLLPAFSGKLGFPHSVINLRSGKAANHQWNGNSHILSEIGSCQVEFAYLSHHSGEPKYGSMGRAG